MVLLMSRWPTCFTQAIYRFLYLLRRSYVVRIAPHPVQGDLSPSTTELEDTQGSRDRCRIASSCSLGKSMCRVDAGLLLGVHHVSFTMFILPRRSATFSYLYRLCRSDVVSGSLSPPQLSEIGTDSPRRPIWGDRYHVERTPA